MDARVHPSLQTNIPEQKSLGKQLGREELPPGREHLFGCGSGYIAVRAGSSESDVHTMNNVEAGVCVREVLNP